MRRTALLFSLCFLSVSALVFGQAPVLTVEIVNDSGRPDSQVYVLMTGSNILPDGGGPLSNLVIPAVDLAASPSSTVYCAPLTNLPVSATMPSVVSTLTGRTNTVYDVKMEKVKSARLFVSYSTNFNFAGATAPTNVENYRYDKFEFDFSGPPTWAANLTSVDFLGIPLRIEAVDAPTEEPFDSRSFYLSTDTIAQRLAHQISLNGGPVAAAIQRDSANNFLRILSPATVTAQNSNGSAAPYPSFDGYLKSLATANYAFSSSGRSAFGTIAPKWIDDNTNSVTVNIPTYQATYNYSGTVTENDQGYLIQMVGTMGNWSTNNASNLPVPIPIPPMFTTVSSTVTHNSMSVWTTNFSVITDKRGNQTVIETPVVNTVYMATTNYFTNAIGTNITLLLPKTQMDLNIYGCPLTEQSFLVTNPSLTYPTSNCTTSAAQTSYYNAVLGNTIYSYVVANVQSGLNFGYLNSQYGNNTSNWFSNILPPAMPFGAGRPENDGFYNPYTALIYNSSDSYGFAFNDRSTVGTNPLMSYSSADTHLRVTVLPDNQLDAPEVTVANATGSGVQLTWPPVANAPSGYSVNYQINSYPPLAGGPVTLSGYSQFMNLTTGVPYTFRVTANAVSPGGTATNSSYAIPVQGITTSAVVMPTGVYTNQFVPAGWTANVFSDPSLFPIFIGGQLVAYNAGQTNYTPALLTGNAGTNYYPIVVTNLGGTNVYQNAIQVVMSAVGTNFSYTFPEVPDLPGNSLPLVVAPPIPANGSYPQGPYSNAATFYPTLSIPGQPESFKLFAPALFPPIQTPEQITEEKIEEKINFWKSKYPQF